MLNYMEKFLKEKERKKKGNAEGVGLGKKDCNFKLGHQTNFHCKGRTEQGLERNKRVNHQRKESVQRP